MTQEVRRSVDDGSLPSTSAISPQMEPKGGFWFGKLSIEWWERLPLAITGKHGEKKMVDNANYVGLECRMRYAWYINVNNEKATDLIPGRTPRKWHRLHTEMNTDKMAPTQHGRNGTNQTK